MARANAWHAADDLERPIGVTIRLIDLPWLNRLDPGWLREAIGDRRALVLLENHYVRGGQGDMVAAAVAELGLDPAVTVGRAGVTELPECGTNDEVLEYHRLDIPSLAKTFRAALATRRPAVSPA